ncbi:YaiI/YqxD family protein [Brevibacillus sp. TJ4]|uniref:YaiI/YqxD family protein n=1 Tax=Brevibacillus sp. TJ4 TaxID=3234853 RepID=UPI0037CE7A11
MSKARILIDADACPRQALAIAQKLGEEWEWPCVTYASYNHQLDRPDHIVVDAGPQAVDMRLANDARAGDIVVTQDIGLAALILGKRAFALSPHGKIYEPERIDFHLEERNLKARFRRGGGRTRGPAARSAEDDARFAEALRFLLSKSEQRQG